MKKLIACMYRFHARGFDKDIPYFATLTSLMVILTFLYAIFVILFDMRSIFELWDTGSKAGNYVVVGIFSLPIYLILWRIFLEKEIKEQEALLTKKEYLYGRILWLTLIIALFVVFNVVIHVRI